MACGASEILKAAEHVSLFLRLPRVWHLWQDRYSSVLQPLCVTLSLEFQRELSVELWWIDPPRMCIPVVFSNSVAPVALASLVSHVLGLRSMTIRPDAGNCKQSLRLPPIEISTGTSLRCLCSPQLLVAILRGRQTSTPPGHAFYTPELIS